MGLIALSSDLEHDAFESFLLFHYPLIAPLLPTDTEAVEVFKWVDSKRDIREYFSKPESDADGTVHRSFNKLTLAIEERLKEEEHIGVLKKRRQKHAAAVAKSQARRARTEERKRKINELCPEPPPPPPPAMTPNEAAAVATLAAVEREAAARERLLETGFTGSWVSPSDRAGEHVKYFWAKPEEAAALMGVELLSHSKAYGVKVRLDRQALLNFEGIKRAGNPNTKGTARLKHSKYSLPLTGPALDWSDFWNVLVGYAYRKAGSADFKIVSNSTKEQLESLAISEKAKAMGRFTAKIEAATRKVAKVDLDHSEAAAGPAKEGLALALQAARATRDGLVAQRAEAEQEVEAKYAKMLEVRAEMDAQKQAIKDKATAQRDALFARKPAADGATAEDGAAAVAALAGVTAAEAADAEAADAEAEDAAEAAVTEVAATEAAEAEAAVVEHVADFAGF